MKRFYFMPTVIVLFTSLLAGCANENQSEVKNSTRSDSYDASKFILADEPEGGRNVIATRLDSQDADEIVVIGRIGGSPDPWVDGRAAFTIVDASVLACSDAKADGEPCSCTTPWDYCCETDILPTAMVLVTFVESDGSIVKQSARNIFDIKELQTVVIQGTAKRDDAGNLKVLATGMFVRQ